MADKLVQVLNSYGYQPVFLPKTGIVPPELYNFANHKLIRLGALTAYFQEPVKFEPTTGALGNIEGKVTSGKKTDLAVGFLKDALAVLGLGSLPKINLSFAGSNDFSFAFTDVTYRAVDPAVLGATLQGLTMPPAIPDDYIKADAMHIAYEYAYATGLTMSRSDHQEFSANVSGNIAQYVDVGVGGKVEVTGNSTVSFSTTDKNVAAFAYKAGRLHKLGNRWTFEPEIVMRPVQGRPGKRLAYLPAPTLVLRLDAGTTHTSTEEQEEAVLVSHSHRGNGRH